MDSQAPAWIIVELWADHELAQRGELDCYICRHSGIVRDLDVAQWEQVEAELLRFASAQCGRTIHVL